MSNQELLVKLHSVSTKLADELHIINESMTGRGISPSKASLVQFKLTEIENTLRKLGADTKNPIPFYGE